MFTTRARGSGKRIYAYVIDGKRSTLKSSCKRDMCLRGVSCAKGRIALKLDRMIQIERGHREPLPSRQARFEVTEQAGLVGYSHTDR